MSEAAVISRRSTNDASATPAGLVLIIDDEAEIRESLQTLLELEGYEVETASTGNEGLARSGDRPFDLVLLDLALPDKNGLNVLAELHERDSQPPAFEKRRERRAGESFTKRRNYSAGYKDELRRSSHGALFCFH